MRGTSSGTDLTPVKKYPIMPPVHKKHHHSFRHGLKHGHKIKDASSVDAAGQHNAIDRVKFNITIKHKAHHKPLGNYQYLHQNYGTYVQQEAYQGTFLVGAHFTAKQLFNKAITAGYTTYDTWATNPFELNPFRAITGSSSDLGYPSNLRPDPDKAHIRTVDCMSQFCNISTVPCSYEFIWLKCKKSTNHDPVAYWGLITSQLGLGLGVTNNPTAAVGVVPPNNNVGAIYPTTYGESPFAHSAFNKVWEPLFRKTEYIGPGDNKKFLYKMHVNKTLNRQALIEMSGVVFGASETPSSFATNFIGGLSIVCIAISRPGIVTIEKFQSGSSGPKTAIATTGVTELAYVGSYKYNYDALPMSRVSTQVGFGQFQTEALANTSGQIIVDTDTVITQTTVANVADVMDAT
jgi:hypothetical protein